MADEPVWAIGLMSGTSMDGIDAVLAGFVDGRFRRLRAHCSHPYPSDLRAELLRLNLPAEPCSAADLAVLDARVGKAFAQAALGLIEQAGVRPATVRVIGSHGQTVFHEPVGPDANSLQLGDPNRIAAATGIATVGDFRRRDIAVGGQGAPLVPAFHHALFAVADEPRCIVNIGGIANVTLLPDAARNRVTGYDTGPGNALMDEWCRLQRGEDYDRDGLWAATGKVNGNLLAALAADPYFSGKPPKSTGRGYFNLGWARRRHPDLDRLPPEDVQRSFCELTASSITAAALGAHRLLVCGGGARNGFLMEALRQRFAGPVESTDHHGLDARHVEATAFAWLALQRVEGLPGNLPAVTGARQEVVLGALYQ